MGFVRLGEWRVVDTSKFAPTDGKCEADMFKVNVMNS